MHALCTATALLATAVSAAAVLGTLEQSSAGYDVVSYNSWQASSFSLAENAGTYRVRQVSLHMVQMVPNANLVLHITGSAFGRPDNAGVRAVLRLPATLPAVPGIVTFTASASPDPLLLPGQTYIESSTGLTAWTGLGSAFADAAGIIRFTDTAGLPRRFYRFQ